MCTVTFVPLKQGFCITSNRDESIIRSIAIPPLKYHINAKVVYFPKDPKAGGTWFAHDKKNCIVLLNGGKEKHIRKKNYRKSRGLIVTELISSNNPLIEWDTINLEAIEPFTIVLFTSDKLYQLQWSDSEKEKKEFDATKHHIWSSTTLYSKTKREERANWFHDFMSTNTDINENKILNFHQFTHAKNKDYGLQINRDNKLQTISITQCLMVKNNFTLKYIDLVN